MQCLYPHSDPESAPLCNLERYVFRRVESHYTIPIKPTAVPTLSTFYYKYILLVIIYPLLHSPLRKSQPHLSLYICQRQWYTYEIPSATILKCPICFSHYLVPVAYTIHFTASPPPASTHTRSVNRPSSSHHTHTLSQPCHPQPSPLIPPPSFAKWLTQRYNHTAHNALELFAQRHICVTRTNKQKKEKEKETPAVSTLYKKRIEKQKSTLRKQFLYCHPISHLPTPPRTSRRCLIRPVLSADACPEPPTAQCNR